MAIKSMTGFGAAAARGEGVRVTVELSSVNRKQLDVALRLPSAWMPLESRVQKIIQEQISRGRISGNVQVEAVSGGGAVQVDLKRAEAAVKQLRCAAKKLNLTDDLSASVLLQVPGLLQLQAVEQSPEEIFQPLEKALIAALKKLNAMRLSEGKALEADLLKRLSLLETMLAEIKTAAPQIVSRVREKLFQRLESHIQQFKKMLRGAESAGRALDFLAQEFFREINTIGSKANELKITNQVVAFKTELERIREQIQNVE